MARALLLCVGVCLVLLQVEAVESYVDPANGSRAGDDNGPGTACVIEQNVVRYKLGHLIVK
jgi:hypothetical protein